MSCSTVTQAGLTGLNSSKLQQVAVWLVQSIAPGWSQKTYSFRRTLSPVTKQGPTGAPPDHIIFEHGESIANAVNAEIDLLHAAGSKPTT